MADTTNVLGPQATEQGGYISLVSPAAHTTAGTDTLFTFSEEVNHVILENHTSANAYYAFDSVASAGSLKLLPGATLVWYKQVQVVHLFTVAQTNINGTADGNILLLGGL